MERRGGELGGRCLQVGYKLSGVLFGDDTTMEPVLPSPPQLEVIIDPADDHFPHAHTP